MTPAASASARFRVTLPSGLWRDGAHLRRAVLRPLTGGDEEVLLESAGEAPAVRVSRLLGRCLVALEAADSGGEGTPIPGDTGCAGGETLARSLVVGDREALLLHLRRHTFGDALDAVLDCPRPECGEPMDLPLAAGDLLLTPYAAPWAIYATTAPLRSTAAVGEGAGGPAEGTTEESVAWGIRFRLPTGADQEASAARLAEDGPGAAVDLLARRCLVALRHPGGRVLLAEGESAVAEDGPLAGRPLPPAVVRAISAAVAETDPQAELLLRLTCPECGEPFSSRFDTASYLFAELAGGDLYRQVHALALHYHWSEADVLSLTPRKRRLYLGLLADAAASSAVAGGVASGAAA